MLAVAFTLLPYTINSTLCIGEGEGPGNMCAHGKLLG